jgi:hypothetical protein
LPRKLAFTAYYQSARFPELVALMKAIAISAMLCLLAVFTMTAGDPDLLDAWRFSIMIADLPAPGFCEVMALPVDGINSE